MTSRNLVTLLGLLCALILVLSACSNDGVGSNAETCESGVAEDGTCIDSRWDVGGCPGESNAQFCASLERSCGEVTATDSCGLERTAFCGSCNEPEVCGGAGVEGQCGCAATTCEAEELACGTAPDACGASLSCGECSEFEICGGGGPNQCGEDDCIPDSCASLSAACGQFTDGCGGELLCGTCPEGLGCDKDLTCSCIGESDGEFCERSAIGCGTYSGVDNCGRARSANCGGCPDGEVCGGGGANQCGDTPCEPATCASLGAECGTPSDGCAALLDCGGCEGSTCDSNFQCGCIAESDEAFCERDGKVCGDYSGTDNCGNPRTANCGRCGQGFACRDNVCECVATCVRKCAGAPDGCGGFCDEPCPTGLTCTGETCCRPETEQQLQRLCQQEERGCGELTLTDRCGQERTVECGCQMGQECIEGQCCPPGGNPENPNCRP